MAGTGTASNADVYQANTTQTKNFDAYVFPDSLTAPPTTISIVQSGPMPMPLVGHPPVAADHPVVDAGSVERRSIAVWTNDQDILATVITESFSAEATYTVDAGRLVYGVTYQVTIYNVEGFQPATGTSAVGWRWARQSRSRRRACRRCRSSRTTRPVA